VILEILDAKGAVVNSYNSETPVNTGRGGRGGGGGGGGETAAPDDPDAAPARRFGPPPPRVTKSAGLNRVTWDVRNKETVTLPPGKYQARLKVGDKTFTEGFNVLIDPRVAEDGVTVADLQEQFEHNMRMREMVTQVNQLVTRVREAQAKLRNASTADNDLSAKVNAIAARLLTEPIRYSKPGLQAHITYLASMTASVDQKIGRDAIERYSVLKKELDALRAEVDRLLGPAQPITNGNRE
jgi:phage gp36-like protein